MLYGLVTLASLRFEPKTEIADLSGKVIIITGGNVGLGRETVLQLAHHNPSHIYLFARTRSTSQTAIDEIQATVPSAAISYLECDLTSFASVQACTRQFLERETRLDLLFLNAGIMGVPPGQTKDGYEVQFGTNHMGHALLTKFLMPTLLQTAKEKGSDVRVISLSSIAHVGCNGISWDKLKTDGSDSFALVRYFESKLANILFARELARRYADEGITAVSLNPGLVNTGIYGSYTSKFGLLGTLFNKTKNVFIADTREGAKGQLWAATSKLHQAGSNERGVKNGNYYTPIGVEGQGTRYAYDDKLAERLWEWTEKELAGWNL